jgi:DNA-3-methyladenine glycosylase I
MVIRCEWAPHDQPRYLAYHDEEWGVPVHDDVHLFEMLTLEGAQAGLSWSTILNKREGYREAFRGFDPAKVARFSPATEERLLQNPAIVRNRLKVESTVQNARAVLDVQRDVGSLDAYLWTFVDGSPIVNRWRSLGDLPAETDRSRAMSKDLKRRGFRFVGPTVCYAFMQACGLVNDHVEDCFRWQEVQELHESLSVGTPSGNSGGQSGSS